GVAHAAAALARRGTGARRAGAAGGAGQAPRRPPLRRPPHHPGDGLGGGAGRRPDGGPTGRAARAVGAAGRGPGRRRPAAAGARGALAHRGAGGRGEDTAMKTKRLGFLGAGNMAGALIKGILHAKVLPPERILVSDVKPERLAQLHQAHGIRTTQDNHKLLEESDVVVLSVKPQVIDKVLTEI